MSFWKTSRASSCAYEQKTSYCKKNMLKIKFKKLFSRSRPVCLRGLFSWQGFISQKNYLSAICNFFHCWYYNSCSYTTTLFFGYFGIKLSAFLNINWFYSFSKALSIATFFSSCPKNFRITNISEYFHHKHHLSFIGNSSQVSDGAAAVIVTTRQEAARRGWPILGILRSYAVEGCAPDIMGIGPAVAIPVALKKAGKSWFPHKERWESAFVNLYFIFCGMGKQIEAVKFVLPKIGMWYYWCFVWCLLL